MTVDSDKLKEKDAPLIVDHTHTNIDVGADEQEKKPSEDSPTPPEDDFKIDKLFHKLCYICLILGVNFYRNRCPRMRTLCLIIVAINCGINLYAIGYIMYLCLSKPFETDRVATSISFSCWILQATLSTIFLAWWQYTSQPVKLMKLLYQANEGAGVHHYRKRLLAILRNFYIIIGFGTVYYVGLLIANCFEYNVGYMDPEIPYIFGDRRLFNLVRLSNLYCILCWAVAMFIFSLLVRSTQCEFEYYNEQVRSIKCNLLTDEALCDYMLKLMKTHNRLTAVVNHLDKMFHRYAFFMLATIIPTTIFSLFMVVHKPSSSVSWQVIFSIPLVFFCVFSFFGLVNAPSQLHDTIYNTKSALCANTNIWFPYRPNVYHSALAFSCHLDQTNLGVSIWGFAVVSKPLVLTTLSVMVTCLALFLQVGECNVNYHPITTTTTQQTPF